MTEDHDNPLSGLRPVPVPAALAATVERACVRALYSPPRPRATFRKVTVDVLMTAFCLAHLVWVARVVHLL